MTDMQDFPPWQRYSTIWAVALCLLGCSQQLPRSQRVILAPEESGALITETDSSLSTDHDDGHAITDAHESANSSTDVRAKRDPSGLVEPIALTDKPSLASLSETDQGSSRAVSHPHGDQICASGCAASHHPTPLMARDRFIQLVDQYAGQSPDTVTDSLDELIYYGPQTERYLDQQPLVLPPEHHSFLLSELKKEKLGVELRVLDEFGKVRVALPRTVVPQHVRQEFSMDVFDLQPVITSGTVKRVGLKHAWQRL